MSLSRARAARYFDSPANAGGVGSKKAKIDINAELAISDSRLENYGLNPRQFKQKIRGQKFKTNKKS